MNLSCLTKPLAALALAAVTAPGFATDAQIEVANLMIQELNYLEQLAKRGQANANPSDQHAINFARVQIDIQRLRSDLSKEVNADWHHGRRRQLDKNPVSTEVTR